MRRLLRALTTGLLTVCCLLWSSPSHAEGRRILVLLGPQEPAVWPRLRAELGSSGFAVEARSVTTSPPTTSDIERLSTREGLAIGVAPLEAGNGLVIWVVDPGTHRLAFREVILGLYSADDAPEVTAVRMVETLRATLMQLEQERRLTPPPPVAPTKLLPPPVAPSRFGLALSGGGAFSPGGVGAISLAGLSLGYALGPRFQLVVEGALTPVPKQLAGTEGTAQLDWYLVGAALRFNVTDPRAAVRLRSGAGAFATWLTSTGQATAPFASGGSRSLTCVPHVDLGLRWSLTERLGLGADASAGFSAPAVQVDFAGRQRASWGRPLWLGRLSLEAALD